jgi:muramoyltetrapeptide carboxypeptidase LdcA involved in peptidoglycan recycling
MDPEAMQHMVQQQNLHLCGCLAVLASYAKADGTIAFSKAVECLEAAPEMNERKAKRSLSRLVEAGWVTQTDDVVSITGYGSSAPPDYARKKPD